MPITNRRGFISYYLCIILVAAVMIVSSLQKAAVSYHDYKLQLDDFRNLNWLEVIAINRVKQKLRAYDEEDESLEVGNGSIDLHYDGLTVTITLHYNGLCRERILEFDDIIDAVTEYY